jgi:hypothetical protein
MCRSKTIVFRVANVNKNPFENKNNAILDALRQNSSKIKTSGQLALSDRPTKYHCSIKIPTRKM